MRWILLCVISLIISSCWGDYCGGQMTWQDTLESIWEPAGAHWEHVNGLYSHTELLMSTDTYSKDCFLGTWLIYWILTAGAPVQLEERTRGKEDSAKCRLKGDCSATLIFSAARIWCCSTDSMKGKSWPEKKKKKRALELWGSAWRCLCSVVVWTSGSNFYILEKRERRWTEGPKEHYISVSNDHICGYFMAVVKSLHFMYLDQQHIDTFHTCNLKSSHRVLEVFMCLFCWHTGIQYHLMWPGLC